MREKEITPIEIIRCSVDFLEYYYDMLTYLYKRRCRLRDFKEVAQREQVSGCGKERDMHGSSTEAYLGL
jgi:hypothetical protein